MENNLDSAIVWIGADWGTTNLRVFAVNAAGLIIEERNAQTGMGSLKPSEFEGALLNLISDWLSPRGQMPVYACGMVGAKQGWSEAGYRQVPCPPLLTTALTIAPVEDPRIKVYILPGLSQAKPPDVMRGEETQIAGFLAQEPEFEGSICLPGTHSKWVSISAGNVLRFSTFMTGEQFSLLSRHSVLKHSISSDGWDDLSFAQASLRAAMDPSCVQGALFSLRAQSVLTAVSSSVLRATLSGLLIGQEIGLARQYWDKQKVVMIGSETITALYRQLLAEFGCWAKEVKASSATVSGLQYAQIQTRARVRCAS